MGQSIGNVIPIAANLGVSTKELFGSLAVLTKNGIKTSEAVTGLKAAYSNILKPGSEAGKLASKLGLNFSAAHLKSVGWAKFLEEVKQKTGGNSEKMAQLFGSTEALNSVMVLAGKGAGDFNKVLKDMNKTTGLTEQAYNKVQTPGEKFRQSLNKLKNSAIKLGDALAPVLTILTTYISKLSDKFNSLTPKQQQSIAKFMIMAAAIGPIILVIGSLTTKIGTTIIKISKLAGAIKKAGGIMAWLTTPGHIVVMVAIAIALVALLVIKNWNKISSLFTKVAKSISKSLGISKKDIQKFIGVIVNFAKIIGGKFKEAFSGLSKQILPPLKKLFASLKKLFSTLKPILVPIIKFIGGIFVVGICAAFSILATVISAVIKTIGNILGGLISILSGTIDYVVGVFTGNWRQAWTGIKSILSGIVEILKGLWQGLVSILTAPVQAVVDILDSAFKEKVAWVKNAWNELKNFLSHPISGTINIAKKIGEKVVNVATGKNALGTSYWHGGATLVGEHGPEIVELPSGSRVNDTRTSRKMFANGGVSIAKLADTIVVREEADIDKITDKLVKKLQKASFNTA